jgi:uncharacterized membrane protein
MDISFMTSVRPSLILAIVFTGGALFFGLPTIVLACSIAFIGKGSWVALVIVGLLAAFHTSSAVYFWRQYLLIRQRLRKNNP